MSYTFDSWRPTDEPNDSPYWQTADAEAYREANPLTDWSEMRLPPDKVIEPEKPRVSVSNPLHLLSYREFRKSKERGEDSKSLDRNMQTVQRKMDGGLANNRTEWRYTRVGGLASMAAGVVGCGIAAYISPEFREFLNGNYGLNGGGMIAGVAFLGLVGAGISGYLHEKVVKRNLARKFRRENC